jgi:peroxiredoxin
MKRTGILSIAFLIVLTLAASSTSAQSGFPVGSKLQGFSLPDMGGQTKSFDDLKGANGAVFVFLSAQCPVVKAYNERIVKLADDYKSKGINVIGINSNATESLDWVKSHADENYKGASGHKFSILIDKRNVWADKLAASVTPEVLFFNAKGELLYRGAIDDDRSGGNIKINYLRDALEANLAGKAIAKTSANAFGCTIKRVTD